MSKGRDLSDYLDDIITAIADTAEFTQGMSYEMVAADKKTANAVIRCLEVIGEAAKHIPTSFRKKHPDLPWTKPIIENFWEKFGGPTKNWFRLYTILKLSDSVQKKIPPSFENGI
jgi:hypothetical protein